MVAVYMDIKYMYTHTQTHTHDSSEPDDEMETGSINGNFKNVFYCPATINLHIFLAEQVVSVLPMS